MKKFFRLGKRMMALFIVALLNINSYAAVGANDGSAFVTKAEFDALVNTFNEQMDTYQSGLNAKIDGAIANYLAGLSGVTSSTVAILTPSWEEIAAFHGSIDPTFTIPKLDIYYGGGVRGSHSWGTYYRKAYTMDMSCRYTYTTKNNNTRALVKCNVSEANQSSSSACFAWDGVCEEYSESWAINAGVTSTSGGDLPDIENSAGKTFKIENGLNISVSDGYVSNVSTLTSVVTPVIYYQTGSRSTTLSFPNKSVSTVCEVVTGKVKYPHIIQYAADDEWCVSEPSFTHTFRTHASSTITSNIMSSVSKNAYGDYSSWARDTRNDGAYGYASGSISFSHATATSKKYASIGMLAANKKASNLLLTLDKISYEYENKKGTVENVKLHDGFPLLAAAQGSTIKWSPRFTLGKSYSTSSGQWVDSTVTRVKLLLSVGKFSDKIASTEIISGESPVGKTTDGGLLCNICKEASDVATQISFVMPKDGVVYAKWVPDTGSYDSEKWMQPIDLTKCNTYLLITE